MGKNLTPDSDINRLLASVKRKHALVEKEIERVLEKEKKEISLPISIFNDKLGMLEAASLYLKDELKLSFKDIAKFLRRDYKTIWTSYNKAKKKLKNEK
jgi:DNA-directed RNA polymerase specialized sigma24 family protein